MQPVVQKFVKYFLIENDDWHYATCYMFLRFSSIPLFSSNGCKCSVWLPTVTKCVYIPVTDRTYRVLWYISFPTLQ